VPNIARCSFVGSEFHVSEPAVLPTVTMRGAQERQHRLRDGDDAEHVGLEDRAHVVERRIGQEARLRACRELVGHLARV